jgi:hypothetical protein
MREWKRISKLLCWNVKRYDNIKRFANKLKFKNKITKIILIVWRKMYRLIYFCEWASVREREFENRFYESNNNVKQQQ